MTFVPDLRSLRPIVERRLIEVPPEIRQTFPQILQKHPITWISFGDDSLLGLLFVSENDLGRVQESQKNGLDPFPGLFTIDSNQPAAFRFVRSRSGVVDSCGVRDSIGFSVGKDSTFVVINHTQDVQTSERRVKYTLPLGYFVSFGDEITPEGVYQNLDELIAYSVKLWMERQ